MRTVRRVRNRPARPKTEQRTSSTAWLCSPDAYDTLVCEGYTRMADNPEVQMAANYVADLISSMTIYLMRNTKNGDVRERNELARKLDVLPYSLTTRKTWMFNIVRTMIIEGNQVVLPKTEKGYLTDLVPMEPACTSFIPDGSSYRVEYMGRSYGPDDILHFILNPDPNRPWYGMGYRTALRDIVNNLRQATRTKKGFMESKWKPSVIIKADAQIEEFSSKAGRRKLLGEYIETSEAGEPWIIPADQFSVDVVKPLSLNDLAINDAVTLDKKTVAGILGVYPYIVGAGDFDEKEHKNFINTYVRPKAQVIEQELTKKLLLSPDLYFRLNGRSLYGYTIEELATVGESLYVRGIMTGNEVRNWIELAPMRGLDDLIILENYIPRGMIGDQKKLVPNTEQEE